METRPLTAAERVAQLIKVLGITSYQFGKETGLSHQTISNVLTGKNRPSLDTLEAVAARYPDTAVWLLTGTGEPRTGRALTPLPAQQHDYTSGPGTVNTVVETLLRELLTNKDAVIASKDAVIELQAAELSELRGKPSDSSDAAGPTVAPNEPTPAPDGSAWRGVRQRTVGFAPRYLQAAELSE